MITFSALDSATVRDLQNGGPDAFGQVPERAVSTGSGIPCRHCLEPIAAGEPFLIFSHRPFPEPQPYAEQGPIFLHAKPCRRHQCDGTIPAILESPNYIVRAYSKNHRIIYGTGQVVPTEEIPARAVELLCDSAVDYVHVRSAANNCYQCRVDRSSIG